MMAAWDDAAHWQRLCDGSTCPVCARGRPLDIVAELAGSFVTASRVACLVYKRHWVELHDLDEAEAATFVLELRRLSQAVQRATGAVKIKLELHGNTLPHLHAHVLPRLPVWPPRSIAWPVPSTSPPIWSRTAPGR